MLLLWIFFVIYVSCLSCSLVCSMKSCVTHGKGLSYWHSCVWCFVVLLSLSCGVVGPVWYLIVSIPELLLPEVKFQNTLKNNEYDREIPQSQTANNPVASWGRATQQSRYTRRTNKTTEQALSLPHRDFWMIVLLLIIPKSFPYFKQLFFFFS